MLAEALLKANAGGKKVFLIFSASWRDTCRRLTQLLDTQTPVLERHFVFVKLDEVSMARERIHRGRGASHRFIRCHAVLCEMEVGIQQTQVGLVHFRP
jgi:hypothetical protein